MNYSGTYWGKTQKALDGTISPEVIRATQEYPELKKNCIKLSEIYLLEMGELKGKSALNYF